MTDVQYFFCERYGIITMSAAVFWYAWLENIQESSNFDCIFKNISTPTEYHWKCTYRGYLFFSSNNTKVLGIQNVE